MADANPLGGMVNIDGGMLSLERLQAAGGAGTRFAGIAAVGTTININEGGTLFLNNGTQGRLDVPLVNANNGSIIGVNGNEQIIGLDAGGTTLNIDGTVMLLTRDLFGPQTQRFPRLRSDLTGTGTLVLLGNTNAGGGPRLVIERGELSTFSGTFRLLENTSLEGHPRNNSTANVGKTIADGDIEFAGWGGTLDVRDSDPAAANVKDYTSNEITFTTTQAGAVNTIAPVRATAATGTGHLFNFGTLTMGDHRVVIGGNNSYQSGFADTANIRGNAVMIMNADGSHAVFSNPVAIIEDAAGRSLTIIKAGAGNAVARDVVVGGAISLSNIEVGPGTLQLRGVDGGITPGFGGAAPTVTVNGGANNFTNGLPTQGLLHLDSNAGYDVGGTGLIAAGDNDNRIDDSATLNMRSNSILRLSSASGVGTTETIGRTNVSGHATFDIVKNGVAPTPVALTLSLFNMVGPKPTANFTGTSLGLAGTDTSRIVLNPPAGTATGFMGPQFHSGNEWAKYDNTVDNGFELGVTPFVAADYTIDTAESTWAAGQQIKQTVTAITLTDSRSADRFVFQPTGTATVNLAGFRLGSAQGGIITSTNTLGITDGATGAVPSGTAGITSATSELYVHNNAQLDIRTPVFGAIDFVKSGTATLRLTHQGLGVGTGAGAIAPFTAAPWSSTLTGSWIINDGRLDVHRSAFLGGRPVILNGGHLEINEPVSNANADTIIPGWGNHITINANATVAADDNGESNDANTGDRAAVRLGSLTINNGALVSHGSFSDIDIAYMGGATFNGTPTLNAVRGGTNSATIINGALTGSGFNSVSLNANNASIVLGGGLPDATANTYNGAITLYAGTLRLNKANGTTAVTDGAASEDIVINGGAVAWGPGQHGDLSTTNNINTTNNGLVGRAPTSPAAVFAAGREQIADTADITLLAGTLGEADRITSEMFGTLIQRNGTFNVGLGNITVNTAIISGGAFGIDRGGTFNAGTLTLLNGAPDLNITTGFPVPGQVTTLTIGPGGLSMSGQNIVLGSGSGGGQSGAGAVLLLGGNVTAVGSDLQGGSYGRKGIFIQTGSNFRELGNSHIDLAGGIRDFNIDTDVIFTITAPLANGSIRKSGGGALVLEPYLASTFAGLITVNNGVLEAKGDGALGTSAGGVIINSGGTVKLNSAWTWGDNFTVSGPGALIPGGESIREEGALISEIGYNRLTGAVAIAGNATLAGNTFADPSVTPATGGVPYRIGTLAIEGAGGVTGAGNLTLSGHGDGVITNGVNITGALNKDGAGRWTIAGPSTYAGVTTVTAGTLRITHGSALGAAAIGTELYGGSLELLGGITVAERLLISGNGFGAGSGAIVNVGGNNTLTGNITLLGTTLRSNAGLLRVGGPISGGATSLTLDGAGDGIIDGVISVGPPASGDTLSKNGSGTWTLNSPNSISGSTGANGGALLLAAAGQKLDSSSPLNMGGGNVRVLGAAQVVNGLNLLSGGGIVDGGAAGLAVGAITRSPGATVGFTGTVTTSSTNTNGILGGYATVGSNWATIGGGGQIVAFGAYNDLASFTAADTDNASRSLFHLATTSLIRNSLRITGGSGIDLGANSLQLTSGGLMYTSTIPGGIGGTGLLSGNTVSDDLIVHVTGADLDINAPIIGFDGGLVKAGPGRLVLSGDSSGWTGPIAVNGGTLSIVGPGGTTHPVALGANLIRTMTLNGGALESVGGDYDPGTGNIQFVIGGNGGTFRSRLGAQISINDGNASGLQTTQLFGSGDIVFEGGGRYRMQAGTPRFTGYTGNVTVADGTLIVGDAEALGGRQAQTLTLKSGSALIHSAATGLGQSGLPNNVVVEGGVEIFALGGNRAFAGDVHFMGTNSIVLFERDTLQQERQIHFNGRVTGTGITLNVFGGNNGNPMYLGSGANDFTGTINLNANAVLEVRTPGSLGLNNGEVTVNLDGANSRLLLRHFQNANYRANVSVRANAEINSDRLVNYAGGANQSLSINNLTFAGGDNILTFAGGNAYKTRIAGTATFNGNAIINTTGADVLFENGINFASGTTLDKRGAGVTMILEGPSNHSGPTILQAGLLLLQDGGALPNTSAIQLRGAELRADNSSVANANRLNNAAGISLGGGILRITGVETALGPVSADSGTTQVILNPTSEIVAEALTLTGFTRQVGAVVQFQQNDFGVATGGGTLGLARVSPRIIIPGQAATTQTISGFTGNNSLDFIQYNNTVDAGQPLGAQDMRNPGNISSPSNYTNDPAETAWNDSVIARLINGTDNTTVTTTLTASRALDAIKVETGGTNRIRTIALGANTLRIEGGGILDVAATGHVLNINGIGAVTAGPAVPGAGTAELVIGGTGVVNITSRIANNGTQAVALVKTGAGTLNMGSINPGNYTGGTFLHAGTLDTTVNHAFGAATNPLILDGGTLTLNVGNAATIGSLGGFGHRVVVRANALIVADNGALAGVDNDYDFGGVTIGGPYTLSMRSFDSMDVIFTGTHNFAGTPTLDMAQLAGGGNQTGFFTFNGEIAGSGFRVSSSGNVNDTTSVLQIGGGEATANTYSGRVTVLQGNNTEDLRVELNKAAGVTAITGDLQIEGGAVQLQRANQIADTSNVVINRGLLNFNSQSETIASVTMAGGALTTNPTTGTPTANSIIITGDVEVTALDDAVGGINTGFTVGNNSTVTIGGQLRIGSYGRVHLSEGATAGVLNIDGGLQMTGSLLSQNSGAGPNITRLSSDVTTLASTERARFGNSTDSDTFTELNGVRTFTVADGSAGIDLALSSVVRNSTAPVAAGSLVKSGPGVMQIEGGGTGNSYSGATLVNDGAVVLFKSAGVNALGNGSATNTLTIGDGAGGDKSAQVIVRNSNQIADTTDVTINADGVLDFDTFNTSEIIGNLTGAVGSAITLGPTSSLTVVSTGSTTYSGSIAGDSTLNKNGLGTLYLDGDSELNVWNINVNVGTLNVDSDVNNASVLVDADTAANFGVSQKMTSLIIGDNAVVTLGDLPGPPPAPFAEGGLGEEDAFDDDGAAPAGGPVKAVPEPGSISLLLLGALGLLGRRRR